MGHKKGMGLLMEWVDIPEDKEDEFNRWYNEERFPQLLAIPGVLNGARYFRPEAMPLRHLTCFELECPEVAETSAFQALEKDLSPWGKRTAPQIIGNNYTHSVYRMIYPDHLDPILAQTDLAPAINIGRQEIPLEVDVEWNRWYNSMYIRDLSVVPGCRSVRRYLAVKGQPRYMVFYELEHQDVCKSQEWVAARLRSSWSATMRGYVKSALGSGRPAVMYRRIFPLWASPP